MAFTETRYAILVGSNNYSESQQLTYSLKDVSDVRENLIKRCFFKDENIIEIKFDNKDSSITLEKIDDAFNIITSKFQGNLDMFLFYYSGHGTYEENEQKSYLEISDNSKISIQDIYNKIYPLKVKNNYLIIDACYSGGNIDFTGSTNSDFISKSKIVKRFCAKAGGIYCIFGATKSHQAVDELKKPRFKHIKNSLLTHFFIDALNNETLYLNGPINIDTIKGYIKPKIIDFSDFSQIPASSSLDEGNHIFAAWDDKPSAINKSIKPISTFLNLFQLKQATVTDQEIQKLSSDYYIGISAKYEHILANLDVIREDKLKTISEKFEETNVVIIHGASGQGKSSLAYRYLYQDKQKIAYELKITDSLKINEIKNNLEELYKDLNIPLIIYIDVLNSASSWFEIIKLFSHKSKFYFLITMREEEWNKSLTIGTHIQFKDLELSFDYGEAKLIYEKLNFKQPDLKFTDFEDAWLNFGGKGPLLEFIYLITQGTTLESRLKEQIKGILDKEGENSEAIELLRIVCIADIFNSYIDLKKLVQNIKLTNPKKIIESFKNEYLIRFTEDGFYLTGVHPMR